MVPSVPVITHIGLSDRMRSGSTVKTQPLKSADIRLIITRFYRQPQVGSGTAIFPSSMKQEAPPVSVR
jgi:hypothetical protein